MNAVIAVNPQQMQEAQGTTIAWVDEKLKVAQIELREAEEVHETLSRSMMIAGSAMNLVRACRRRVAFYEKVKAALDAGYYIIPPFPVQVFAIRTDRDPAADLKTGHWGIEQAGRSLPIGEGRYVNPTPTRALDHTETEKDSSGAGHQVNVYRSDQWRDVELPVRAFKPQVIEATGKALAEKIFDALGILPSYQTADPMIVGQIRRPQRHRGVLTFFVAWWLDERDL